MCLCNVKVHLAVLAGGTHRDNACEFNLDGPLLQACECISQNLAVIFSALFDMHQTHILIDPKSSIQQDLYQA